MITHTFLTNFALGFILAAEFGQVSIEIFRRGIRYGFWSAVLVSFGGSFADFIYLNIAITGVILILNDPNILKSLWVIGGCTVFYISINGIHDSFDKKDMPVSQTKETNPFMAGFLLNFIHPINLIWWVTILSSIIVKDTQEMSVLTAYLNGTGIFIGVFVWWFILSLLTSIARQRITMHGMQYISMCSSLLLLGFSFWFFYNATIL